MRTIDLSGSEGNAFALLAIAKQYCRANKVDFEPIKKEMMSGDYKCLLETFEKNFGKYAQLINKPLMRK